MIFISSSNINFAQDNVKAENVIREREVFKQKVKDYLFETFQKVHNDLFFSFCLVISFLFLFLIRVL